MLVVKLKVHQRAKVQSHSNIVSHEQFTLFSVSHLHSESSWNTSCCYQLEIQLCLISEPKPYWIRLIRCWFFWIERNSAVLTGVSEVEAEQKRKEAELQANHQQEFENSPMQLYVLDVARDPDFYQCLPAQRTPSNRSARGERDNSIFAQEECDCNLVACARAKHWLSTHSRAWPHRECDFSTQEERSRAQPLLSRGELNCSRAQSKHQSEIFLIAFHNISKLLGS